MTAYLARRLVPAAALAAAVSASIALLLSLLRFGPALAALRIAPAAIGTLASWAVVPALGVAIGPGALVGGVLALGRMRADGELVAASSLGVPVGRLARVPVAVAGVVLVLAGAFALVLEPAAMRRIRSGLEDAVTGGVARAIARAPSGRFSTPLPGVELYRSEDGVVVDAAGTVLAARRARARVAGRTVVLVLDDATVREGTPPRTLDARRLEIAVPTDGLGATTAGAIPIGLGASTSTLARSPDGASKRLFARRLAAPALAAAFALWVIPLGLGGIGRSGRAIGAAAAVLAAGHVILRLSEAAGPPAALAMAPLAVAIGALLASRRRRPAPAPVRTR